MRLYNGVHLVDGPSLRNVERLDMGCLPMIDAMQQEGLLVDLPHFDRLGIALREDMESLTEQVKAMTGKYVLLSSGDQVADLLFRHLKLVQARPRMTASGDRESVENDVLEQIKHAHPVVPLILQFKEVAKLENTYVRPMAALIGPDGRIRPNFRVTRVSTGRLSCNSPNLMAIPVRSKRGKDVRRGFIAPPGWVYVSLDLSQIEMRVSAHHSGCKELIRVYEDDLDVYSDFAMEAFHLPNLAAVNRDMHRTPAKTCVLGVMYDVSAKGLLEQMPVGMGWDEPKCAKLIAAFYAKYPEIMIARMGDHGRARQFGFVWCMFGRIRHIPEIRSKLRWVMQSGMRQAGNQPIQAGAQGVIKLMMAECQDIIVNWKLERDVKPKLQVHDELIFECRKEVADEWLATVGVVAENCCPLRVPIKWGGAIARSWGELK